MVTLLWIYELVKNLFEMEGFLLKMSIVDPIMDDGLVNQQVMKYVTMRAQFRSCPVFRFYTLLMVGTPVENLIPLPNILEYLKESEFGDENTKTFDLAYANQLLTYQPSFIDLMQILGSLQFSEETFLLCDMKHPNVLNTMDSFIKFLQERYSLNVFIIKDVMDIDELKFSDFGTSEGYNTFIQDLDRYKMTYFTKEELAREVIE